MVDAIAVQALSKLLQQAIDSVVIREKHQGFPIGVSEYLSFLASHRRSCVHPNLPPPEMFQLTIQNKAVRKNLYGVIRNALGQYIHNDMLQSAKVVTGGAMNGFHIDKLLEHLLTIVFVRGAGYAANNFYQCVDRSSVGLQAITMIDGVRIKDPIEISEGIRFVPIPNDAKDFPPYIVIPLFGNVTDYFGKTLIIVDEFVSPVFARPDDMSTTDHPALFKRSNVNTEHPNFAVEEFCEALSLSINHVVNCVSWWSYIDPDEAYAVNTIHGSIGYDPSKTCEFGISPIEVNEIDVQQAMSLYVTRKNLRQDVIRKLRIPIDRWIRSKTDIDPVDTFINLGTALESLYLEGNNRSDVRFKLALRAAWHLGNSEQEKISLKEDFSEIYKLRSDAVHTGIVKKARATPEFTVRAQKLCLISIIKIIQDGEFPDWDRLIMGSG